MAKLYIAFEGKCFYSAILVRGKKEERRYSHEDPMKVALEAYNFGITPECTLPPKNVELNPAYTLRLDELPDWRKERFHEAFRLLQTY